MSWIVAVMATPLVDLTVALDCSQSFGAPMVGRLLCFGCLCTCVMHFLCIGAVGLLGPLVCRRSFTCSGFVGLFTAFALVGWQLDCQGDLVSLLFDQTQSLSSTPALHICNCNVDSMVRCAFGAVPPQHCHANSCILFSVTWRMLVELLQTA